MNKLKFLARLRKKKIKKERIPISEVAEYINKIDAWLASGNVEDDMLRACDRAEKSIEYYRKAREIDWSKIHEPMTI